MQGRPVTQRQRERFLKALTMLPLVSSAAQAAGLSRMTVYRLRKQEPAFAAAWDNAMEEALDALEAEAWRRAVHGYDVYLTCRTGLILDKDGQPVMQRRYSDVLAILLLNAYRPELYRDRITVNVRASAELPALMDEGRARVQAARLTVLAAA